MFSYFNNRQLRRYLLAFGSFFDSIYVTRDAQGVETQRILVPLQYGPKEKWLVRLTQDPELTRGVSQVVPRMSYELTGVAYDPSRKLNTLNQLKFPSMEQSKMARTYVGVPYNITINLSALVKYQQDGFQIVEQIFPFFTPDFTFAIQTLPDVGIVDQIPLTLNSVTHTDNYEGSFEQRRVIIWELNFTMKAFFYGPSKTQGRIEEVQVDTYNSPYFDLTEPPTYFATESGDFLTLEDDSLLATDLTSGLVSRVVVVPDPLTQNPLADPLTVRTTITNYDGAVKRGRSGTDELV
jgi:T4-like virus Myoviridae tail sheath stabiliser